MGFAERVAAAAAAAAAVLKDTAVESWCAACCLVHPAYQLSSSAQQANKSGQLHPALALFNALSMHAQRQLKQASQLDVRLRNHTSTNIGLKIMNWSLNGTGPRHPSSGSTQEKVTPEDKGSMLCASRPM
jgi:hypothetical protein